MSDVRIAVELRELAARIEQVAKDSAAWGIVYPWVRTLTDHLYAVARVHETRTWEEKK